MIAPLLSKPGGPLSPGRVVELFRQATTAVNALLALPILDGALLEDVELASGATTVVKHKLGRAPRGLIVVKSSAAIGVPYWDSDNPRPTSELWIVASAATTATLWVF